MPIYEYECQLCSHVWDELRRLSDPNPEACPACGKNQLAQRMTAAGFRLKGGGWYETDFKKDSDTKRNLVEAAGSASESSASSSAGESASAAAPAAPAAASAPTPAATPAPAPGPASGS
jgi:putative FmdB family regulatory protein